MSRRPATKATTSCM